MAAPPPISPSDAATLNRYLHHPDLPTLAADCFPTSDGLPDLTAALAFLTRPDIAAWIDLYRSLEAHALRHAALDALIRVLRTSPDPLQLRLAATTVLHATRPDRATDGRSPRTTSVPIHPDAPHPSDLDLASRATDARSPRTTSVPIHPQAPHPSELDLSDRDTDGHNPQSTSVPMSPTPPPRRTPAAPHTPTNALDHALSLLGLSPADLNTTLDPSSTPDLDPDTEPTSPDDPWSTSAPNHWPAPAPRDSARIARPIRQLAAPAAPAPAPDTGETPSTHQVPAADRATSLPPSARAPPSPSLPPRESIPRTSGFSRCLAPASPLVWGSPGPGHPVRAEAEERENR